MRIKFLLPLLLLAGAARAQAGLVEADIAINPNYFVTVLFGVMLAIGFQFLLTSLSVAIGVSAVPNLKESWVESKYDTSRKQDDSDWTETRDSSNTGVLVSSALGIWNVVTAAVSLFGATALALTLTHVVNPAIAMTLGLTIWAVFYLLMFYLEGRMVGTAIGGLIGTAVSGLRAGGEAVKSLFTPSPAGQVQQVADHTIEKLRNEMSATFDTDSVNSTLDRFFSKLDNRMPSYDKLRDDLRRVVTEATNNGSSASPATWTAIQGVINKAIDENGSRGKDGKIEKLRQVIDDLRAELGDNGPNNGTQQFATAHRNGGDAGGSAGYVQQVKDWLQRATPESFDVSTLTEQFSQFASNPSAVTAELRDRAEQLDKQTLVKTISANTQLERDRVEQYADQALAVLEKVQRKVSDVRDGGQDSPVNQIVGRIETAVRNFVDSTDDPRLNYADLKNDLVRAMNNPSDSLNIAMARLRNFDRDTLVSVLTNNPRVNRSDINRIADQVESTKTDVMVKLQEIEDTARSTAKNVERRAVIQAEGARKAAVAAAWWLFTAIVVSGVAAVAGSQLGAF